MSQHAVLSPSSAHRWAYCPASVLHAKKEQEESIYAAEGTAAHALSELCFTEGRDAAAYIGQAMANGVTVDEEMADFIQQYVDYVRSLPGIVRFDAEVKLNLEVITGERGAQGTADIVALSVGDTLHVIDLKYGRGHRVEAEHNLQLLLYALAALDHIRPVLEPKSVHLAIHQPRNGGVSEWQPTLEELDSYRAWLTERAARALHIFKDPSTAQPSDYSPGEDTCRWCPARRSCNARNSAVESAIGVEFENLDVPILVPSDTDQFEKIAASLDFIEQFCEDMRKELKERVLSGKTVKGFKVVRGREGNRTWDTDAVIEYIKDSGIKDVMYKEELVSPAVAEKLAKKGGPLATHWKDLSSLVFRSAAALTVARDTDKRPAVEIDEVEFDNLNPIEEQSE